MFENDKLHYGGNWEKFQGDKICMFMVWNITELFRAASLYMQKKIFSSHLSQLKWEKSHGLVFNFYKYEKSFQ